LSPRKEVQDYSGKDFIQVRGALTCILMISVCFRAILDDCNVYCVFLVEIWDGGHVSVCVHPRVILRYNWVYIIS